MRRLVTTLGVIAIAIVIALAYLVNIAMASTEDTDDAIAYSTDQDVLNCVGQVITLEKESGETAIENSAGKILSLREGSKMYNGYKLSTGDGYMWIALDDNGVLKMDMDTEIVIQLNGSDLEILLVQGEVFFNISESYGDDESFTIRTSTMSTGIRGTAGIISTSTPEDSEVEFSIKLLEGLVDLTYVGNDGADTYLANKLEAGQEFSLCKEDTGSMLAGELTNLGVDDIDGFVAIEIVDTGESDSAEMLQEKILSGGSLIDEEMINAIIENAAAKLAEDEMYLQLLKDANEILQIDAIENLTTSASSIFAKEDITVSFYYYKENDEEVSLFATQIIEKDSIPEEPYLQPSANGNWYYYEEEDDGKYQFKIALDSDTSFVWLSE